MKVEPQQEHHWLQKLVGEWTYETQCDMGPDQPPSTMKGTESIRSFGGLWTIGEGTVEMPDGSPGKSIMTLGYDPKQRAFVGTWVGTMMAHLWRYRGTVDATGQILTLDSEGPSFADDGKIAKYQDIISFVADDHRVFTARIQNDDGSWNEFMKANYRRKT